MTPEITDWLAHHKDQQAPLLILAARQGRADVLEHLLKQGTGLNTVDQFGPLLLGEDVANAIDYIVSQPPHVHISDIMIRPTRQDYP